MSSSLFDRILSSSINVKHRLESLLNICRIYKHPSWLSDDSCDEFYRFYGPDLSDIQELEDSIVSISVLIEHLQHERNSTETCEPFPNYPLCKNGWTLKDIEQIEKEQVLNLNILNLINLHSFNACNNELDKQQCLKSELDNTHIISNDRRHLNTRSLSTIPNSCLSCTTNKNLLDLPIELLLHIFSFISPFELITNLAPTCRYFANLVLNHVYTHIDLYKAASVFDVTRLLSYLTCLRTIAFINWDNEVSILAWAIWFDRISKATSNLHTIRFQNVYISPILICFIVEYFPHCLQSIIFDYQQVKSYERFDLILSLLADKTIQLKHITASYQTGITNFGILQLVNNLNMVVELNLLYIEAINDETVKILCDKHNTYLEILKIDGAQLTDKALEYIDCCRKLKSFMIEFCTNMIGSNFYIFQNFDNLKELCLSKLTNASLESFQLLFDGKHIFRNLALLKLGECHSIDDNCVRSIITMCPRLIDFMCSWAYSLTDGSFNEIAMRCQHLRRLSLVGCHQIYGRILDYVPEKYFHHIEYLNFEQCNQIEDELLIKLYKRKKSISIINYYGTSVDDDDDDDHDDDEDDLKSF
ncbi:unnamed protein product [Rotaria socialis]|uniref:F-box domain-containing protein n=1 Tax=Rotaria socialis TaxID=392032 RepID=A0A819U6F0_9BILA|nr:unnamed protein product [Rotaria socialis]CAF3346951.1 unnamed protein product [Rotaria socialis]CAF4098251.1 unnamed protein product [Rotaria socialis]CAF4164857.1 unnamed protein product [Rotaria socialis]